MTTLTPDEMIQLVYVSIRRLKVCVPATYSYSGEPEYETEYIEYVDPYALVEALKKLANE